MESQYFNRTLFPRNNDTAFKLAVMFTRFSKIDTATQEILFFSNKEIVKEKINFLAFTEMYNETLEYTNNWLRELDRIKDEFDWEFHRSKLVTRFLMLRGLSGEGLYNELKNKDAKVANSIRNTSTLWTKAVIFAQDAYYDKRDNPITWELWDILVKYKHGNFDEIKGDDSHLKELKKVIKYRKEDKFFKDYNESLNNHPEIVKEVEKIEKELETIFFKDKLNKELPIISTIRKKLKI